MSRSVHVRLEAFRVLGRSGVRAAMLRSLHQLRLRPVCSSERAVVLDVDVLPPAGLREPWLLALLRDPRTHRVSGMEEAVEAARALADRYARWGRPALSDRVLVRG